MKHGHLLASASLLCATLAAENQHAPSDSCCMEILCYSPAYREICCDLGVTVYADFLYWYGKESRLPYLVAYEETDIGLQQEFLISSISAVEDIDSKWEPGVRVGVGFSGSTGWDSTFEWTYYKNSASASSALAPAVNFNNENGLPIFLNIWYDRPFTAANIQKGKWSFDINRFALSLGHHYEINDVVSVRPHVGASGYFSDTLFRTIQTLDNTNTDNQVGVIDIDTRRYVIRFDNENWGGGMIAGFDTYFGMGCGFSLYGSFDVDLLWGRRFSKVKEDVFNQEVNPSGAITFLIDYDTTFKGEHYGLQPIFDVSIGLQWKWAFCDCRYQTLFQVGWEHRFLPDHNTRRSVGTDERGIIQDFEADNSNYINFYGAYAQSTGDVMFGGLTVRVQFDF